MLLSASEALNIAAEFIPGIASALGAGMCLRGEMCGIANGALMIIGLLYGRRNPEDSNEIAYYAGDQFLDKFHNLKGTFLCSEITGLNFHEDNSDNIWYSEILNTTCAPLLVESLKILCEILDELPKR